MDCVLESVSRSRRLPSFPKVLLLSSSPASDTESSMSEVLLLARGGAGSVVGGRDNGGAKSGIRG